MKVENVDRKVGVALIIVELNLLKLNYLKIVDINNLLEQLQPERDSIFLFTCISFFPRGSCN